jgi:transposase-like protein
MKCPYYQHEAIVKNGKVKMEDQNVQQYYLCSPCGKRFNERVCIPITRLSTSTVVVSAAIDVGTEGLGVRTVRRSFGKAHATIMCWERGALQQWQGDTVIFLF